MGQCALLNSGGGTVNVTVLDCNSYVNSVKTLTLEKDAKYIIMQSTMAIIRDGYNFSVSISNNREQIFNKTNQADAFGRQVKHITVIYKDCKKGDVIRCGTNSGTVDSVDIIAIE